MNKKGISLIVLIITIIVVIILAGGVVLSLISNNPIKEANKAAFLSDVESYKSELLLTLTKGFLANGDRLDVNVEVGEKSGGEYVIKEYIASMKQNHLDMFGILNGELAISNDPADLEGIDPEWVANLPLIKTSNSPDITVFDVVATTNTITLTIDGTNIQEIEYFIDNVKEGNTTTNKTTIFSSLTPAKEYVIKVIVYSPEGKFYVKTQKVVTDVNLVLSIKALTATATTVTVETESSNVESYEYYIGTNETNLTSKGTSTTGGTFEITGLTPNTAYVVKVVGKTGVALVEATGNITTALDTFGTNGNTTVGVVAVNKPKLATNMKAITFNETTGAATTSFNDSDWYAYVDNGGYGTDAGLSKWANAKTMDGSQFVWIPRYAYKITTPNSNIANQIEIVFLKDDTDDYYDNNGNKLGTAVRVGSAGAGTTNYMVHPAFTNEMATGYKNGGWDKELTGFWVAKYEAGYAGVGNYTTITAKNSSAIYSGTYSGISNVYGVVSSGLTAIKYPIYLPNAYSYNYITTGDLYNIARKSNESGNPYGFTLADETHLMKDSEWGAVAYLTHSKYGRNGNEIRINNTNKNNSPATVHAVTGMGARVANETVTDNSANAANQFNGTYGKLASTTKNVYGIYDLSGGLWERVSGYILNTAGASNRTSYGSTLINEGGDVSTKYKSICAWNPADTRETNYTQGTNPLRKGEAMWETSNSGDNTNSWFGDCSIFMYSPYPFNVRGGYFGDGVVGGTFAFTCTAGDPFYANGFRVVVSL